LSTFDNIVMQLTKKFINDCNKQFPGVFFDYYLCGSQQDNTANCNSDIDLILVTETAAEQKVQLQFRNFIAGFNNKHHPPIGAAVFELASIEVRISMQR